MLIALELWHLKRICDKNGLDYQEIDNTLTYAENLKHLRSLVAVQIDERMKEVMAQEERYRKEYPLYDYVVYAIEGKTKSKETGAPLESPEARFSLVDYIKSK